MSDLFENHIVGFLITWLSYGPPPIGPKEIDGLLVSPGKASKIATD